MPLISKQRRSLLSSQVRIQAPFIKVTIGDYTFGIYTNNKEDRKNAAGFYQAYDIKYPNYIQSMVVTKINGQVNQYTLNVIYPITQNDDPNFFEKVLSSNSKSRKIIFTYGDSSAPSTIYKNEEAIITNVTSSFDLQGSKISYQISAVSGAQLNSNNIYPLVDTQQPIKPSDRIKRILQDPASGLPQILQGMDMNHLENYIAGDDQYVKVEPKLNSSALDVINYLVSYMIPAGTPKDSISKDIYIMTLHDNTNFEQLYNDYQPASGPYLQVTRTSYLVEKADAFELDIGYNTATLVRDFKINNNENYALLYDYQAKLAPENYVERLNEYGEWEKIYAPVNTSKNPNFMTRGEDITWWTKITKYPITATVTVQGLLRPTTLMTHLRLNIIFPGGRKHIASGLYIITKQVDTIGESGYFTTLSLTKISGDTDFPNRVDADPYTVKL